MIALLAKLWAILIKQRSVISEQPTPSPVQNTPPSSQPITPVYLWDTPTNARHSVRVICDEMGLSVEQKNELCATIQCESGGNFDTQAIHPNVVNGKTSSTDYGLCQINDYYHIGPNKDFPSKEYVLANPEACVRWMCTQWKGGRGRLWVCFLKGLYKQYL